MSMWPRIRWSRPSKRRLEASHAAGANATSSWDMTAWQASRSGRYSATSSLHIKPGSCPYLVKRGGLKVLPCFLVHGRVRKTALLLRGSLSIFLVEVPTLSTSPNVILLAKSELRKIDVWYESESRVCPHTNSCKTDFASSIKTGQEPNFGPVLTRRVAVKGPSTPNFPHNLIVCVPPNRGHGCLKAGLQHGAHTHVSGVPSSKKAVSPEFRGTDAAMRCQDVALQTRLEACDPVERRATHWTSC
jgi:hypothetical protein